MLRISRRDVIGLGLASSLPQVASAQADTRPTITVAVQKITNTNTLDTLLEQSSNPSERVTNSITELLIGRDYGRNLERIPALATAWRRIDERTVELTLRRGVKFHDGGEMTAEDVAFSFGPERMFGGAGTKKLPAEVPAVARRHWPALKSVDVVDANTVRFVNATPDVTMEGRISAGGSEIVSRRAFEQAASWIDYARKPIGTGPYKVRDYKGDNILTLDAHDEYWGGRPPIKTLRFVEAPEVSARVNGLLSGLYDFACDIPPDQIAEIERNRRFAVQGGTILNHRIVNFDMHHPTLRDPRVRLAMAHAIDGQAIVDSLWAGRTRVPPGLQWEFYNDMFVPGWTVPPTDVARAKQLLKDAGYKGDAIPYRIRNDYYTAEVATAQVLVEMWREARPERRAGGQRELVPGVGHGPTARPAGLVQRGHLRRPDEQHRQPGRPARRAAAGGRMDQRRDEPPVRRHGGQHRPRGAAGDVRADAGDLRTRGPRLYRVAPERDLHRQTTGYQVEGRARLRDGFPGRELGVRFPPLASWASRERERSCRVCLSPPCLRP